MSEKAAAVICLDAEFEGSYPKFSLLPSGHVPEVAIAGRSNVGKSSVLNNLLNRKSLARVGRTPGVTRMINLFPAVFRREKLDRDCRIADLPGYGFAKVSDKEQERWGREIDTYLAQREMLRVVLVLQDARRELTDDERYFFSQRIEAERWLIVTKIDQVKDAQHRKLKSSLSKQSGVPEERIFLTSSLKRRGFDEIRAELFDAIDMAPRDSDPSQSGGRPKKS